MAMIVMASCAKENVQPNENNDQSNILEIGLTSTKTALGEEIKDGNKSFFPIVWSEGDEIAVIENMGVEGKQNVSVYRLKDGAGTANGVFEHINGVVSALYIERRYFLFVTYLIISRYTKTQT